MISTRIDVSLKGRQIGISGAVPDRGSWSEPAMDRAILEFIAVFCGIVFKYGGRIVHGSHPTFTPVILRQARLHANSHGSAKPIILVRSELWADGLTDEYREGLSDVAELVVTKKIGNGGVEDVDTRNRSLTEMRHVLVEKQNVMVAVGGKMHEMDGKTPGVLEEMDLAGEARIPRFLVAGMGGFAAEYARKVIPAELNNGLSFERNAMLFSTTDVSASVNIIFEQLTNIK